MHQVPISETLDVEMVERELGLLWKDSAAGESDDFAVMRARVANLMIMTGVPESLDEIHETLEQLSAFHPSRALIIVAEKPAADRDIELFISSFHQTDSQSRKRLCCEEVMLNARGKFVPELPSVALPLLVPDLPTFLWWREALQTEDRVFKDLCQAADRLVIDSAELENSQATLLAMASLFASEQTDELGISDINWARLTSWRGLLASFYDLPHTREILPSVTDVVIDYSAHEDDESAVAPQALLFAGWLMSRLGWDLSPEQPTKSERTLEFKMVEEDRSIQMRLNRVDRPEIRPGRLARAQLATKENATFCVLRHENGLHLETRGIIDGVPIPGRVLPVRNRSTAHLLGRELEIICNDRIYCEAVAMAAKMIKATDFHG
jgi:glucose-6-phosphate dehydrogenase assembly protein OpcA